jgi:hypothetical protein
LNPFCVSSLNFFDSNDMSFLVGPSRHISIFDEVNDLMI